MTSLDQQALQPNQGNRKPFVIGVAGGSGSGKSTVADRVIGMTGHQRVAVLVLDSYYKDREDLDLEGRAALNYDHPDAFDWTLMIDQLGELRLIYVGERRLDEHRVLFGAG